MHSMKEREERHLQDKAAKETEANPQPSGTPETKADQQPSETQETKREEPIGEEGKHHNHKHSSLYGLIIAGAVITLAILYFLNTSSTKYRPPHSGHSKKDKPTHNGADEITTTEDNAEKKQQASLRKNGDKSSTQSRKKT